MNVYLYIILAYLIILMIFNFYRARKVKSQEDFMVAGRSLGVGVMVFTLICTWIGSGTFIAGAEFSYQAGFSAIWMAAGAWLGIILIYFLAGKIRTFGQYTIGDIMEVRYGRFARLAGSFALIISFITIVSYQFVAGGFILNVITDGAISAEHGTILAAIFVILFTALGGMMAELDNRELAFNITDTLRRRKEGYHWKLVKAQLDSESDTTNNKNEKTESIHDLVLAKEKDLDK